jgi:hypothetical protein
MLRPLLLFISCALSTPALAWGAQGHTVVASLAWQGLQPKARQEVTRLLALEPGQTLESVATWADEHRSAATGVWHYVNFPRGSCNYEPLRDCPDGKCVVAAIARQQAVFASHASDGERLKALKYLVHLVADVHQPLHAGYADDRGGNQFQLRAFMRGSNLHALWDSGLLRQMELDNTALVAVLQSIPLAADGKNLNVVHMAQESCRVVAMAGFYPQGELSDAYVQRFTPIVQQRLALAGARLAAMLNAAAAMSD